MGLDKRNKVLVVDDNLLTRSILEHVLTNIGYESVLVQDGFEALEIYKESFDEFSGVILDLKMPGIDGFETYDKLLEINPGCKIIVHSADTYNPKLEGLLDEINVISSPKPLALKLMYEALDFFEK